MYLYLLGVYHTMYSNDFFLFSQTQEQAEEYLSWGVWWCWDVTWMKRGMKELKLCMKWTRMIFFKTKLDNLKEDMF